MVEVTLQDIVVILSVAFIPPILFAALIHGAKRYRPEPGYALRRAFLWGALGAALVAVVLNTTIHGRIVRPYLVHDTWTSLATAVVVAPLVEETAKLFGLRFVRNEADEPVDGLIYGATIGLGFSATENLFYETSALAAHGFDAYVWTALARTFSSSLLHATATAMACYGVAKAWSKGRSWLGGLHWWLGAVLLHSAFNLVATVSVFFGVLGVIPLVAFGVWAFGRVRTAVSEMSLVAPTTRWQRVGPPKVQEQAAWAGAEDEARWRSLEERDRSTDRGTDAPRKPTYTPSPDDETETWYPR